MKLTLGSLFDGIAGFPLSASYYGITTKWASEIEALPIKVSQKHFPDMKHLGDVIKINGLEIEPVDIISFGSPCQDMSVAGKRVGLFRKLKIKLRSKKKHKKSLTVNLLRKYMSRTRSGLFIEAVRIIREMRVATNGVYPRLAIWENVPGAFSSNNSQDFRAVLEEITETEIPVPKSGRWAEAGMVGGNGHSVAWRVLDAQYWGVPQRRKRIFLVADFGGQCAGEILFECESMSGHFEESGEAWEEVAGSVGDGVKAASRINCEPGGISGTVTSKWAKGIGGPAGDEHYNLVCLNDTGGQWMDVSHDVAPTLRAEVHNHPPCVVQPKLYDMTHAEEVMRPCEPGVSPTLNARMGTGGNQVPVLMHPTYAFSAGNSAEARSIGFAEEVSPTLKGSSGGNTVPVIAFNGRQDPISGLIAGALDTCHPQAQCVAYPDPANTLLAKANLSYRGDVDTVVAVDVRNLNETEELSGTLQAKSGGGYSLNYINPIRIPIRSDNYADADERNARKILSKLWQEVGTEAFEEWGIGVLASLQKEAVLRQGLHEGRVSEQAQGGDNELGNESHSVTTNDTKGSMSGMWGEERSGCSPQGQRLYKQRTEQSDSAMQGLSQLKAQASEILCNLWRTNEGIRILQQTLYSIQKVWESDGTQSTKTENMQGMWRLGTLERIVRETLHASEKGRRTTTYRVRRLSPMECLRLQGFPDNWLDIEGASDSAKYKAVGNSVAIPCVEFIFSQIVKVLERSNSNGQT